MSLLILKGDRHQGADRDRAVCGLRGIDCVTFLAENREAFIVMIILITGASHTGKTMLAQKMLEKYGYPYLSIDHLKMELIRSGNTNLTPEDDDALTEYLWPIVREMIKTAVEYSGLC